MSNKHTPGPWKVKHSESKPAFNIVGTRPGGKYKLARVPYEVIGDPILDERAKREAEADAKLMAGALDLLDALTVMVGFLRKNGFTAHHVYKEYVETAQTAIKKATN